MTEQISAYKEPILKHSIKITGMSNDTIGENQKVVIRISFIIFGEDSEKMMGSYEDEIKFERDSAVTSDFIPFEQLTEETVIGWVKDSLTSMKISFYDNIMLQQIKQEKERRLDQSIPWLTKEVQQNLKTPGDRIMIIQKWAEEASNNIEGP